MIRNLINAAGARRTSWRRARNLRKAAHGVRPWRSRPVADPLEPVVPAGLSGAPAALRWTGAAGIVAALGGAVLIVMHARNLVVAADALDGVADGPRQIRAAAAFQSALPGAAFDVPAQGGIALSEIDGGAMLIAAGIHSAPALRLDLCAQMQREAGGRLSPVRIGYGFDDVARLVARNGAAATPVALRNVVLSTREVSDMPQVQVSGNAAESLQLRWDSTNAAVSWISDAGDGKVERGAHGQVVLRRDGWLVWRPDVAMHIQRRASAACPQAGELLVQIVRARSGPSTAKAQVASFPIIGQPVSAWLAAGSYQIPAGRARALEDQALFQQLHQRGMLRLGTGGMAELVPRDLAAWRAAPELGRAGDLAGWDQVRLDLAATKLLKRLYRMADGDFVREQVRIFNGERRLLAWRVTPGWAHGKWQASVASAPASISQAMPTGAARLFATLGPGWAPWSRIEAWPAAANQAQARLTLLLPGASRGGETMQLMLIGRAGALQGARLRKPAQDACTGRACPSGDSVQLLALELLPGVRSVSIDVAALDMAVLATQGDQKYRHLSVVDGRLEWRALAQAPAAPRPVASVAVTLEDRHGAPLWRGGAPTAAAIDAGLAPLLGMRADHASSIAGMLARLPSPSGAPHAARLTLDLALQAASQGALACIGMRRGEWDGKTCTGGQSPPAGRRAGMVILDTESGDVLAAAGAGGIVPSAANWNEVRNLERSDPARSPLRLPAFQHDGGAHSSPGSTFKVISALGLEQAALRDPQIEALLGGMALPAINRMAREKGFAFQTDAASYPAATRQAHITNYKAQHLDRRAHDGKLGLAQALTYSLNTWFAWTGELSDRSLFGRAQGGVPDLQPLEPGALDSVRPIVGMANRLGFGQSLRLDGGLLPADYRWSAWDALQASASQIDPIHTRHELRQMSIGLRMQVTPLQMALAAGAVGQGHLITPRLLLSLDERDASAPPTPALGVRLDRIRAGMKGVVDIGTAAGAFRGARFDTLRRGLSGKTGTSPSAAPGGGDSATVWFMGWLEPGSLPGQTHRLALATFVSHSEASGGEHAAPIVAAVLASALARNPEQKGK